MAAGDISHDTGSPRVEGSVWVHTGTIEVDETPRGFAVAGSNRILTCHLQDRDGVGVAECNINVDANNAASNGSIRAWGNHNSVETYQFIVRFVM